MPDPTTIEACGFYVSLWRGLRALFGRPDRGREDQVALGVAERSSRRAWLTTAPAGLAEDRTVMGMSG